MILVSKVVPEVFLDILELQNYFFQKVMIRMGPKLISEYFRYKTKIWDKNYDFCALIGHISEPGS